MLIFNVIENGEIFTRDFRRLAKNNEIAFPQNGEKIVAIYGPNGTGKTSLIKALSDAKGTEIKFALDENEYTSGAEVFHIINDQNDRNIITGKAKDFFIGDNIKREFDLQKLILEGRTAVISNIAAKLKSNYSISAMNSPQLSLIENNDISEIVKDIVNSRSRG